MKLSYRILNFPCFFFIIIIHLTYTCILYFEKKKFNVYFEKKNVFKKLKFFILLLIFLFCQQLFVMHRKKILYLIFLPPLFLKIKFIIKLIQIFLFCFLLLYCSDTSNSFLYLFPYFCLFLIKTCLSLISGEMKKKNRNIYIYKSQFKSNL